MTYVITQPCIGTKVASCVDVCPVDCIHPTQSQEPNRRDRRRACANEPCLTSLSVNYVRQVMLPTGAYSSP